MSEKTSNGNKVLYGKFGSAVERTPSSFPAPGIHEVEKHLQNDADPASRKSVLEHIRLTFKSLVRKPVETAWIERNGSGEYDHNRPAFGPYGGFIGYYEDGKPNHFIKHYIDTMRDKRAYTRNAIELRCDALCLAIYVSGLTQIDMSNGQPKAHEGVRIAVYDHNNPKHTTMSTAKNPEELVDKLHHILASTYNRLAREYNLAGFTTEFLTLVSSHKAIPNIRIDMN